MTGERNTDRAIRSWLADDLDILPDRVLDAVVAELPVTRQERRHLGWLPTPAPVRLVAIAAVLVAAVAVGLAVIASPDRVGAPAPTAPLAAPSLPISPSPRIHPDADRGALGRAGLRLGAARLADERSAGPGLATAVARR